MNQLNLSELCAGVATACANAAELLAEAKLLFENQHYSRSYALAYMSCEEMGKVPILLSAAGRVHMRGKVDWKDVTKRFRDHEAKAKLFLSAAVGASLELLHASGAAVTKEMFVDAINEAQDRAASVFAKRNSALYTEESSGKFVSPSSIYGEKDARASIDLAKTIYELHVKNWGTDVASIEAMVKRTCEPEALSLIGEMTELSVKRKQMGDLYDKAFSR